tara:strand:- start:418 stop:1554 length:1137 start_codon:yes stop_codon:yes gene_type:complete
MRASLYPNQTAIAMDFNNKKLTRTTTFIHYLISFLLAIFLIGLANRIIWDMDVVESSPTMTSFEAQTDIRKYQLFRDSIRDIKDEKRDQLKEVTLSLDLENILLSDEKSSFSSWISTRRATQSASVNNEIKNRNRTMDSLQSSIKKWKAQAVILKSDINKLEGKALDYSEQIQGERDKARVVYYKAIQKYDLHIFLSRLLFVIPILLLGIWMLVKKRGSGYWPLFRGFVFFSVYAFFVGLVPYLPSYGGYVRYSIGILLSVFMGIYAIRSLKAFVRRKKEELQRSTEERSKHIKDEVAESALENHMCPSCGKDFLINEIHQSGSKKGSLGNFKITPYCRHCGLELFKNCGSCDTQNYAHLPHCYSCGDHIMEEKQKDQ